MPVSGDGALTVADGDLPAGLSASFATSPAVGWDIETSGLDWRVDVIGTCQLFAEGVGTAVIRVAAGSAPPRLSALLEDPGVVKAVGTPVAPGRLRALYFTRATAPSGDGPLYHHIGLYAFRRAALERFVALPPSPLEQREKLEQLRALEAGMRIDVAIIDSVPIGVNTPEDLARARAVLSGRS